jgi:hypothetical protein
VLQEGPLRAAPVFIFSFRAESGDSSMPPETQDHTPWMIRSRLPAFLLLLSCACLRAADNQHGVWLDGQGKLVSWVQP